MSVRVRYAPSPTGSPHVGNVRDALFKHLFAKHHNGTHILRIEDTDRTRYVPGCEEEIIESLNWLNIEWQEGVDKGGPFAPYRQSERQALGIYDQWIKKLLNEGYAYKAFDTPEELAEMREFQQINKQPIGYFGGIWRDSTPAQVEKAEIAKKTFVIRLKIPRGETIVIEDAIRGRIEWDSNTVDDTVLIKADQMPTYHFAAMVDDHLMEITHIIRGEEWISSAPKHAYLLDAFGWTRPTFVHCPVIKGKDGSKLSKRHGDTRCLDFRNAGFLPEALVNFIALIGWSPGGDRELLDMEELIEAFDLDGLQPSPGIFDLDKLRWMNGNYIRGLKPELLLKKVQAYINAQESISYWSKPEHLDPKMNLSLELLKSKIEEEPNYTLEALKLEQERVHTLADFAPAAEFFFTKNIEYDPKAVEKWFFQPHIRQLFNELKKNLQTHTTISTEGCEQLLKTFASNHHFEKLGPIVHPVRVALTGKTVGPGLFELMSVLGPLKMLDRLNQAEQIIAQKSASI